MDMSKYATEECVQCGDEFTAENPCCCDEGTCGPTNGITTHVDGVCVRCCAPNHIGQRRVTSQHERGE